MKTLSPRFSGANPLACSLHRLWALDWRLPIAVLRRSSNVWWGGCRLAGIVGRRSRIGRPRTSAAGDIFVSGAGVFR